MLHSGMVTMYVRRKEPLKGLRHKAIPTGAGRAVFDKNEKFLVRYTDASGKFVWSQPNEGQK
jgi:hypothetical protein